MRHGLLGQTPREFWPWNDIAHAYKRETNGERWVLTGSFIGDPVWVPWMGTEER